MSSPNESVETQPAPIFAALGDATRLSLLSRLMDGDSQSISRLAAGSTISRQAITKHLRVLEESGLVVGRKTGRERHFSLRIETIAEAKAYLDEVSQQWDRSLARLRRFVEQH